MIIGQISVERLEQSLQNLITDSVVHVPLPLWRAVYKCECGFTACSTTFATEREAVLAGIHLEDEHCKAAHPCLPLNSQN